MCGDEMGEVEMKGVPGLVELVHCFSNETEWQARCVTFGKACGVPVSGCPCQVSGASRVPILVGMVHGDE